MSLGAWVAARGYICKNRSGSRAGYKAVLYDAIAWSVLFYAAGHQAVGTTWRVTGVLAD